LIEQVGKQYCFSIFFRGCNQSNLSTKAHKDNKIILLPNFLEKLWWKIVFIPTSPIQE